jgi:WD40 repeat protein
VLLSAFPAPWASHLKSSFLIVLSTALLDSVASAGEPPADPILRIEAGMHTAMINGVDVDSTGRYAVTASDDKSARVWDIGSGRLLLVLRPPQGMGNEGYLDAQAMSPDGTLASSRPAACR